MEDIGSPDLLAQLLETRDSWPELWEKHWISWPTSALTAFPLEHSSTEAAGEIDAHFTGVSISGRAIGVVKLTVLQAWTAAWGRTCLQGRLAAYRDRTKDKSTQKWLDEWTANGYGDDTTLKLCDVGSKVQLAHHIICAVIYKKEIRVLTEQEASNEQRVQPRLLRHLEALKSVTFYRVAFAAPNTTFDWFAEARFFSSAIEHGGAGSTRHY
ncbi:hypothetical protein CCR75_004794 [Bremia lactucae]|uniref:Uncharacterized protein n=1 Tax=Bremia lactucae TaxID=4779 RepID=A0A976FH89_BRELC|nr:hypothetical protein CCR75_004794 [Bremia lactucae]